MKTNLRDLETNQSKIESQGDNKNDVKPMASVDRTDSS